MDSLSVVVAVVVVVLGCARSCEPSSRAATPRDRHHCRHQENERTDLLSSLYILNGSTETRLLYETTITTMLLTVSRKKSLPIFQPSPLPDIYLSQRRLKNTVRPQTGRFHLSAQADPSGFFVVTFFVVDIIFLSSNCFLDGTSVIYCSSLLEKYSIAAPNAHTPSL